jgi:transcriptional regulator with GAF, ATPase, and Fis domain
MGLFKSSNEVKDENAYLKLENELITKFIKKLNSAVGVSLLVETIINEITEAVEAETATLYSVDGNNKIRFTYVYGGDKKTTQKLKNMTLEMGQGIVGSVVSNGKSEYVEDAEKDKRFFKTADKETGFVTKSLICTPLKLEDSVIGAIQVLNKKGGGKFSTNDMVLLERLAEMAAFALHKEKLYEKITYEKEFNEYIIENIAEGVFVVDKGLNILGSNNKLLEMCGSEHQKESIVGHHVDSILGYLQLTEVYEKVFMEGQPYRQSEQEAKSLQFTLIPRKNSDDVVTEVLTIVKSRR